jgi:hypothetical protein
MELRTLERLLDLLCTSCCQLIFLKKGWVVLDLIHAVHAQVVRGIAHSQAGQDRARTGQDLVKEGGVLRHVPIRRLVRIARALNTIFRLPT